MHSISSSICFLAEFILESINNALFPNKSSHFDSSTKILSFTLLLLVLTKINLFPVAPCYSMLALQQHLILVENECRALPPPLQPLLCKQAAFFFYVCDTDTKLNFTRTERGDVHSQTYSQFYPNPMRCADRVFTHLAAL